MTSRIADDIREEFDELRTELNRFFDPKMDFTQARNLIAEHAPRRVVARAQLLLDTLLNYLMEDAEEALAGAQAKVQNEFYDLDLRDLVKKSFILGPELLKLSFDPRLIAGGVAASMVATATGLATTLFLFGLISRIVGGVATLVTSALAFKFAYTATTDIARKWLQDDVEGYVTRSEQQVSSWLASVEECFVAEFKKFQDDLRSPDGGMG